MEAHNKNSHHHILPTKTILKIGGALLFLTVVTVWIAQIDLGSLNFPVAMAVATVKALLVVLFFMNLYYDHKENAVIFGTSFLFLAIFLILTSTDVFFRGDVAVKGPLMAAVQGGSKLKKPWVVTPELVAKGKELYAIQCVSCHGVNGHGDGPAASALKPAPRNFTVDQGWKNGRKVTQVFKTLKEGLAPSAMASYETLPVDDRWALSHYVSSLGPSAPGADTPEDFKKIGVDPSQESSGGTVAPTIPLELALERVEVPGAEADAQAKLYHPNESSSGGDQVTRTLGARLYQQNCVSCHGDQAQGGIRVPQAVSVVTSPLTLRSQGMLSESAFVTTVIRGYPGNLMPGYGQLSATELHELYQYLKGLAARSR